MKRTRLSRKTPLARGKPLKAGKPMKRGGRLKFGNAYTRPEWRALDRAVKQRAKGVCELCGLGPVEGDSHHLSYAPFTGWRRLIVPMDQLVAVCRPCHLRQHLAD